MDINNAKKRLLDSEQELSYSQRIAISDLIESLHADLIEMCNTVKDTFIMPNYTGAYCKHCKAVVVKGESHGEDCPVLKAEKNIKSLSVMPTIEKEGMV